MFEIENLQWVGSAPRRGVFRRALDALDGDGPRANRLAVKPVSLVTAGSAPALPEDALSDQRFLLNCILNLSKLLAENAVSKLSPKQIDYAQTIYAAGTQLLAYVDRQVLDDLAHVKTYRGPRSRHSDDGLVLTAESDPSAAGRRRSLPELAGKKVLIVDDDILNIYAMTGALEQQGMIVMHADSGPAALEMLRAQADTDAIILNSGMLPPGNQELITAIRGLPSFESIPIIAVISGKAHVDRDECVEIGASDFIDKPINVEQLLSLMRAWLARS